jgi:hypothetical protein
MRGEMSSVELVQDEAGMADALFDSKRIGQR